MTTRDGSSLLPSPLLFMHTYTYIYMHMYMYNVMHTVDAVACGMLITTSPVHDSTDEEEAVGRHLIVR